MRYFHATRRGKKIGDGTAGVLVDWLNKYINILFPENGIEYWSDNRYADNGAIKRFHNLPLVTGPAGNDDDTIHHIACYVRQGGCEGRIIEVAFVLKDNSLKSLTWAKTFGSEEECWEISRAIYAALDSIFFYEEIPEIVEMADKLPKDYWWKRESSLSEIIHVKSDAKSLSVKTESGLIFAQHDWFEHGVNAKFYVESYAKDWNTVLTNMNVNFDFI